MNAALMVVKDNALIVGLFLAAWAIWKVAGWKNVVDASLQLQSKNIERLTESVQNLTNNVSRLDARVDALSEKIDALSNKVDTQIAALSDKMDTQIAALSNKMDTQIAALSQRVDGLQNMFTVFLEHQVTKSASPRTLYRLRCQAIPAD